MHSKEETKASLLYDIQKVEQLPVPVVFVQYKMDQKRHICYFRKYRPISLKFAIQFIIGSDERIFKFRINRTGSDVIMATQSFSYIIHCNFEIEYLQNAK